LHRSEASLGGVLDILKSQVAVGLAHLQVLHSRTLEHTFSCDSVHASTSVTTVGNHAAGNLLSLSTLLVETLDVEVELVFSAVILGLVVQTFQRSLALVIGVLVQRHLFSTV